MLDRHLWGVFFLGPPHMHFLFRDSDPRFPGLVIRGIISCRFGARPHADWRRNGSMMYVVALVASLRIEIDLRLPVDPRLQVKRVQNPQFFCGA